MSQNYYELLKLTPGPDLSQEDVKQAYREALLKYHPDKLNRKTTSGPELTTGASGTPTVNMIVEAYNILLDPLTRRKYDLSLKTAQAKAHQGIETFDLEDLVFHEDSGNSQWTKSCRCGSSEGYFLSEDDLEKASSEQAGETKEVLVGCRGCSLFIRVAFASVDET